MHDAETDRDKGELFAACRAGTVAVLIGSTEKRGIGSSVQFRAIAPAPRPAAKDAAAVRAPELSGQGGPPRLRPR